MERVTSELGHIDVLINNAGIASFGTIVDMPPEEWERMIQVNLLGTYYVTRAVLPGMIAQNRGNIINAHLGHNDPFDRYHTCRLYYSVLFGGNSHRDDSIDQPSIVTDLSKTG